MDLLSQISLYFGVDQTTAKVIESLFEPLSMDKGDLYMAYGSTQKKLGFISDGFFRVYRQTEKQEFTQWIASSGEFITDLGTLSFGAPCRWKIEAITPVEMLALSPEKYERLNELIPHWMAIEKAFISKCFITLEERVFSFISMSAEERYQLLFDYKRDIFNQVPHHYIASMLGMTPETMSRVRRKIIS